MNTLMPKVVVLAGLLAVAGGAMAGAGSPVSWSGSSDDGATRDVSFVVNKKADFSFSIMPADITDIGPEGWVNSHDYGRTGGAGIMKNDSPHIVEVIEPTVTYMQEYVMVKTGGVGNLGFIAYGAGGPTAATEIMVISPTKGGDCYNQGSDDENIRWRFRPLGTCNMSASLYRLSSPGHYNPAASLAEVSSTTFTARLEVTLFNW